MTLDAFGLLQLRRSVPQTRWMRLRTIAALIAAGTLAACTEDPLQSVLDGSSSDPAGAGVVEAIRRPNGTIAVTLRGMKGVFQYEVFELETADGSASGGQETRVLRKIVHSPGKVDYQIETNDIPFGKNFCYRARAQLTDGGDKVPLKIAACLQDNNSWAFAGVKQARADQTGSIVLNWNRVPTEGVTYKIFRRFSATEADYPADATQELYDKSEFVDEVRENVFPRCYIVKAYHSLFSRLDTNSNEVCLTKETYAVQVQSTPDALSPDFRGIDSITATEGESSLLSNVMNAAGLTSSLKVRLTWSKASDNLSPAHRIRYRIYRSEKLDLGEDSLYASTEPGVLFFVDNKVPSKKRLNYLVRAVDDRGNEDGNFNWRELPLDFDPPQFGGIASAKPERRDGNVSIRLSWEPASDNKTAAAAIEYLVYRIGKGGTLDYAGEPLAVVKAEKFFLDGTVSRNSSYIYGVRARDAAGNIDSNITTIEAKATGAGPIFAGLNFLSRDGANAVLGWNQASDDDTQPNEIAYAVYRSTDPSNFKMDAPIFRTGPNLTAATDPTTNVGTEYYYRVRAIDKNGFEDENTETLTLAANKPPAWPMNTRPSAAGPEWKSLLNGKLTWEKNERGALLQWSPPTDDYTAASKLVYYIYRSDRSNGFNYTNQLAKVTATSGSDLLSFVDKNDHQLGQGWFYVIRAEDEFKSVSLSSSIVELPANSKPSKPVITGVLLDKNTQRVTIQWNTGVDDRTAASDLVYRVYRFEQNATGSYPLTTDNRIAALDGSKSSYIDAAMRDPAKDYVWIVQVLDAAQLESDPSDPKGLGENTPPTAGGIISAIRASGEFVSITWSPSDDAQESNLTYKVYAKEVALSTNSGVTTDAGILSTLFIPGNEKQSVKGNTAVLTFGNFGRTKAYVFGVRAFDSKGLFDANMKGAVVSGNPAPTFAGLTQAELIVQTGKARLTWVPGSDDSSTAELDYRIYKLENTSATATAEQVLAQGSFYSTSGVGNTAYEDNNIRSSVTTHYLVRCIDPLGSEDTNTVVKSIPPDVTRPVFLGIKATSMNGRKITLTWDPASDNRTYVSQIKYQIYESTSSSVADLLATTPIAVVTGVPTFNGLDGSGTGHMPPSVLTHYYLVRAVDEAGNSDTNGVVKSTVDVIPPVFAGLQLGYPITNKTAQLFWTAVPDEDIYQIRIFRSDNMSTPFAAVNARTASGEWVNSYVVTGLTPATNYSYVARAVDGAGNTESNTATVSLTTLAGEAPLFAGLQSAIPALGLEGMSKINLKWSAAEGATHYRIFRVPGASAVGADFNWDYDSCKTAWNSPSQPGCVQIDADGNTEYVVTNLSKNTVYSFVARAVILANDSLIGEEQNRVIKSPRTLDEVAPTFPGATSAAPAAGDAGLTSAVIKWDLPTPDGVWDGFQVLYKDFSGAPAGTTTFSIPPNIGSDPGILIFTVPDVTATEATVGSLTLGKRYCFTVVTRYTSPVTVRSAPANPDGYKCTTPAAQPPTFAGVKAEVQKGVGAQAFKQFTVNWDPAIGSFSRYEVSWSKTNTFVSPSSTASFFSSAATMATITNRATGSYTITNLDPNETYYVRVRAVFERTVESVFLTSGSEIVTQNVTTPVIPNGDGVLTVTQISDAEVEVKWDAPNNNGLLNTYHIFRASGSSADNEVLNQALPSLGNNPPYASSPFVSIGSAASQFNTRTWVNTGVLPETRYCYLIKASYVGSEGFVTSPNVKVKCVDVQIKPPEFNGIVSLEAPNSASGFTSLVAKWEKATGNFSKYQVSVTSGPDAAPVWVDINGSVDTVSFTVSPLIENSRYYVRVRAVYVKAGFPQPYAAGEANQLSAVTTPKAPQHSGLEPIEFVGGPGEIKIKWDLPNPVQDIGGVYDRIFVWKMTPGTPTAIMDEINTLLTDSSTPDIISSAETLSPSYSVDEVLTAGQTEIEYRGANKLQENVQTCFLVRAAYRAAASSPRFLMSGNQTVRCVTPTASAPIFGGIAKMENIPLTVNGFSSVKASWIAAQGVFTRYEIVLNTISGANTWTPRASSSNVIAENFKLLYNLNESGAPQTAISNYTHKTLYGRVRAIYVGSDGTVYAAGENTELPVVVRPDRPEGDGIRTADATKIPGVAASAKIVLKGDAMGFWDSYFVWREISDDQGTAYNAVLAKAKAVDAGTSFFAQPTATVNRTSSTSTTDITYTDSTLTVGKYNCYIARAGYNKSAGFLLSATPQAPICVRPQYNPISFSGVAATGSEVCNYEDPANPVPCSASTRWSNTGNSMIRLRLNSAPAGDIDYYDVYRGSTNDPVRLLASTPFQIIAKGDAVHDPNADDIFLHVGGDPSLFIPAGNNFFLVRARCLGCSFVDTNTSVSNAVEALQPFVRASYGMKSRSGSTIWTSNRSGYGVLEDEGNQGVLGTSGFAELTGDNDYLRSTNPVAFAPKPGTTFGIKFNLLPRGTSLQNVEGSAIFAADVGNRQPTYRTVGSATVADEGSLLGIAGASTVYDKRNKTCLFIGGYAGQGIDVGDWPSRDWRYHWLSASRHYANRFQVWDGMNLGEIRTRTDANSPSPLPRSMPVVAYNPVSGNVMLFGGFDQSSPQRLMADTWEWDGSSWTKLADGPTSIQLVDGAVGRYGHGVLTHDPYRNEMMMVGGRYKVWDQSGQAWNEARTTITSQGDMGHANVLRDVRNDKMWHFRKDANGLMNWQVTATLPAAFPKGYPAQLVTVPPGSPGAGVYYFSARWDGSEWSNNNESNNVWKYDGNNWSEVANSRWMIGGLRPMANLYGSYDSVKQRIVLTFGRGNEDTGRVIWEYDPAQSASGAAAWTTRAISNSPFVTYGAQPCFHEETRDLVIPGGIPLWSTNQQVTKRSQTPQDVFVYNTQTNSWRRHNLRYDSSSMGMMATHEGLRGVIRVGGPQFHPFAGWWEHTTAYLNLVFKNGFWSEIAVDNARKFPWGTEFNVNNWGDQKLTSRSSAAGVGDVYGVYKSGHQQITTATTAQAVVEYGQPKVTVAFDGSGWNRVPVTSTNLKFHDRFCTNSAVTPSAAQTFSYPQFEWPWSGVATTRGFFAATQNVAALWPYPFNPTSTVTCSAAATWRYASSPFILVTESGGAATVREIKQPGTPEWLPSDPNKFCAPPSAAVNSVYLDQTPYMEVDPVTNRIWLFGAKQSNNWSIYYRDIQSISFNSASNCYQVENFTAPFDTQAWTSISSYNDRMDYWGYDKVRNVVTVFGKHGTSSTVTNGPTMGVIWELNLNTRQWKQRLLPDEFRRWSTLAGSFALRVAPIPGKSGEYYVSAVRERHNYSRYLSEGYIIRITDSAISLRPILPRFGLTLGSATGDGEGTAGYLSVPGDNGDVDRVYAGETLYQGRRKIANDLVGSNSFYVVFGNSTYSAFLNGVRVATDIPWDPSGGLYMMDFILGARYGSFYRHDDDSQSGYKGIGNTNIQLDWVRSFNKSLSDAEMNFWSTYDENAGSLP
jgi:fibronectin type 3 domain-containing protein